MTQPSYSQLTLNGLWKNNPALVQLLGLCPLLAVTASTVNALGLAAATLFVLVVSNTAVSLIRNVVSDTIRLPVFVMIIAAAVTITELLMQAFSFWNENLRFTHSILKFSNKSLLTFTLVSVMSFVGIIFILKRLLYVYQDI